MHKVLLFSLVSLLSVISGVAQKADFSHIKPAKNIILLISDGTSLSTLSLARWYNRTLDPNRTNLSVDPYISGSVLTYCSDAPIGDSAPTTSTYMNGMPSQAGFINSYPVATDHDLVPVDPTKAYRPLVTVYELAHLIKGKKNGIVVTCEFPHATPADMASHYYNRKRYDLLAPQLAQNGVDVLFGGGVKLATPEVKARLEEKGITLYTDDRKALISGDEKVWGLFSQMDLPYDIDRDTLLTPSISEMTATAIEKLKGNEQGFFLMVEGSKVDWAAHANDPVGMATEFLAFDKAVQVALDFAQKDRNTVVIVTSDHGNSGLALGRYDLGEKYAETSAADLFGILTKAQKSATGLSNMLIEAKDESQLSKIIETYGGFVPSESDLKVITALRTLSLEKDKGDKRSLNEIFKDDIEILEHLKHIQYTDNSLDGYIASLYTAHTHLGYTTNGHTGEEVFLASFAPEIDQRIVGFNTNIDLNNYIRALVGINDKEMSAYTDEYFCPARELFKGATLKVSGKKPKEKVLTVEKDGKRLVVRAFSDKAEVDGQTIELPLTTVYVDKNDEFYLPKSLTDF